MNVRWAFWLLLKIALRTIGIGCWIIFNLTRFDRTMYISMCVFGCFTFRKSRCLLLHNTLISCMDSNAQYDSIYEFMKWCIHLVFATFLLISIHFCMENINFSSNSERNRLRVIDHLSFTIAQKIVFLMLSGFEALIMIQIELISHSSTMGLFADWENLF